MIAAENRPGAIAVNTRTAEFLVIKAKSVILCMGAAGRLGLPTSGYMYGTYENAANAGDGYAMAYHAGAALANLECFQINPLIKDYNGPACAYVAGPFGAYTANNEGARFIECDYWSGQMMLEFFNELQSGKGPVFLKLNHLHEDTISEIETILHKVERPTRGLFHEGRGTDYRKQMVEMHISEIGFCSGHSASGVFVDDFARTTIPGLYAAGDMASVPHNYMLGAFTNGAIAGEDAASHAREVDFADFDPAAIALEKQRVLAPTRREDGIPPNQIEYKTRRLVNDYLQPPKVTRKYEIGQARLAEVRDDMEKRMMARNAHELLRALETQSILDCADMAAFASLYRTESRWGLYHLRADHPEELPATHRLLLLVLQRGRENQADPPRARRRGRGLRRDRRGLRRRGRCGRDPRVAQIECQELGAGALGLGRLRGVGDQLLEEALRRIRALLDEIEPCEVEHFGGGARYGWLLGPGAAPILWRELGRALLSHGGRAAKACGHGHIECCPRPRPTAAACPSRPRHVRASAPVNVPASIAGRLVRHCGGSEDRGIGLTADQHRHTAGGEHLVGLAADQ